jgi:hypothetical protein
MLKSLELAEPNSCLNRAKNEERIFVLLARDPAAPKAIREWVKERIRLGKNRPDDPQMLEAIHCADLMQSERESLKANPHAPGSSTSATNGATDSRQDE